MKTREQIREELIELYGAREALSQALLHLHDQQMDTTKKIFALNHMLQDMDEGEKHD
jgi:hypothetical protein